MKIPYISGEVGDKERINIISHFRDGTEINTILFSRVGDTSIDIPNANVIIQVASHKGSQRQETQRLGRILRPKQSADKQAFSNMESFNAYFYTLVSLDTKEVEFADNRQQHLINQGFYFEIIKEMPFMRNPKDKYALTMSSKEDQLNFLTTILKSKDNFDKEGIENERELERDEDVKALRAAEGPGGLSKMWALTGGDEFI